MLYWNFGKIELQLTFNNLYDALYWYSPQPALVSLFVPGSQAVYGTTPFPHPQGCTLIPIDDPYALYTDESYYNEGGTISVVNATGTAVGTFTAPAVMSTKTQDGLANAPPGCEWMIRAKRSSTTWSMNGSGVQLRLSYARLVSEEA